MNNKELEEYRRKFHENLEQCFCEKQKLELKDYRNVLSNTINETRIKESTSKKVYVYMGSYINVHGGPLSRITYNNDPELHYKMYKDIETGDIKTVYKKMIEVFEEKNKVLYPYIQEFKVENYYEEYKNLRELYFKELLNKKQKDAYILMKKLTPSK